MTDPYDMSCHHCGKECVFGDDYYMVTDEVWYDEAGLNWDDFLCRGCLMSVLGRPLVYQDYTDAPVNFKILRNEFGVKLTGTGTYNHRLPNWDEQ